MLTMQGTARSIRRQKWMRSLRAIAATVGSATAAGIVLATPGSAPTLMRYPTSHGDQVVFVAHDELWEVPSSGGQAHRLFEDAGSVIGPRFSPDGHWIAFTSRRGGRQDLYVMPSGGGEPRRLTFEGTRRGTDGLVLDWTPDSRRIVYLSSGGTIADKMRRALSVSVDGGPSTALPLDETGPLSFSSDGRAIVFNRVYRNDELRKRYVGGQAQNLYTYEFASKRLARLTRWKGTDTAPMWHGRRVYFLSNRGAHFRSNIWVCDLDTNALTQVTHFQDFDVDSPSLGDNAITFQQGGKLYSLDLGSQRLRELAVTVPDDGSRTAVRSVTVGSVARVTDVAHGVDYAVSPDGKDAVFSARGDVFRLSANGDAADVTNTPGADEQHAAWSPDGTLVAYQTDSTGEQQIAIRAADGRDERILTHFKTGSFYMPIWAPDGRSLVVPSANHELWLVHVDGSAPRRLAVDPAGEIRDAAFSPDGRLLAYSTLRPTRQRAIHLLEVASGKDSVVSSPMESDRNPAFSADGLTLYFISRRNEFPLVPDRGDEAIIAALKSDGLYAAPLVGRARPDAPRASATSAHSAGVAPAGEPAVDIAGMMARATKLPVEPAEISTLEVRGHTVYFETHPPAAINGDLPGEVAALHALDLDRLTERRIASGLDNHSLSADGSTVLFRRDGQWHLASTLVGAAADTMLDPGRMQMVVDPRQEWREMWRNAWRLDRDLFFSAAMNGNDWESVRRAYEPLLSLVGSQDDFLYLLGELQGEIGSSHTYVVRGASADTRKTTRTPLLGADLELEVASGRYRIAHVVQGDNTRERYRSPLQKSGGELAEGDYLLTVDGRELTASSDPRSVFAGAAPNLRLGVATTAYGEARDVDVEAIDDETDLRQKEWADANRRHVDKLSGGTVGYVFVADFEALGSEDFLRQFYPQLDKQALVIDVRWNNGGFTSQAVLNVLQRRLAGSFVNREGAVEPLPKFTAPLAMATLMNQSSGSDGDQFPYFFRHFGLGTLIGTRTWGGVQGIDGLWRLMDGTGITIPKDSLASIDGHWLIENEGVAPDIAIENDPDALSSGHDRQLDTTVETLMKTLRREPRPMPRAPSALPAYPTGGSVPGARF